MNLFKNEENHHNARDSDDTYKNTENNTYKNTENNTDKYQTIIGFILFIIIFVGIIPYILLKNKYYTFLEAYMPNIDLIANLLSWHQGVLPIWKNIYKPYPRNNIEFSTQTIINYMALLGLTFIVIRESHGKGREMASGWSIAFIMLLMTYLLPSKIINQIMQKAHDFFASKTELDSLSHSLAHISTWFIGLMMTVGIIWLESKVIKYLRLPLFNLSKKIISLPKMI